MQGGSGAVIARNRIGEDGAQLAAAVGPYVGPSAARRTYIKNETITRITTIVERLEDDLGHAVYETLVDVPIIRRGGEDSLLTLAVVAASLDRTRPHARYSATGLTHAIHGLVDRLPMMRDRATEKPIVDLVEGLAGT